MTNNKKILISNIAIHRECLCCDAGQLRNSYDRLITSSKSIVDSPITSLDQFLSWYLTPSRLWELVGTAFIAGTLIIPPLLPQGAKNAPTLKTIPCQGQCQ